jgi:hypothetical protein
MRSILLTLWPGGRPAEACTKAPQTGRNTPILFMARLCSLAEPTDPVHVSRAYVSMASPGRGVFQHPAGVSEHASGSGSRRHRWRTKAAEPTARPHQLPVPAAAFFAGATSSAARAAALLAWATDSGISMGPWAHPQTKTPARVVSRGMRGSVWKNPCWLS